MSHALPVISTRHSGIPEAITHEADGLLLASADPEALAACARALLAAPADYSRIAQAARTTALARFSTERCLTRLEAAYDEAIALRIG